MKNPRLRVVFLRTVKKKAHTFSVVLDGEIEGTESRQRKQLFRLPIYSIMGWVMKMENKKRIAETERYSPKEL
ncbi:MAG: hypothetical protein IKM46_03095 [Clostridia bacterium]|nr:hypothetical protein [Clostridia bacterium]